MKVNLERLSTVSQYARDKGVSATAVYKWIELGKVESVKISGVIFIVK